MKSISQFLFSSELIVLVLIAGTCIEDEQWKFLLSRAILGITSFHNGRSYAIKKNKKESFHSQRGSFN